jgi:hypothetical protein
MEYNGRSVDTGSVLTTDVRIEDQDQVEYKQHTNGGGSVPTTVGRVEHRSLLKDIAHSDDAVS